MFRRTVLSTAVAVAISSTLASTAAFANEESVEKLEKIQVTGSRISRVDVEGSTPVVVFDREAIESSGAATIAEFLKESPMLMGPSMITENETLSQVAGASGLNYRGFGNDATLILLNGRRLPDNPISSTFVDVNQLPSAAVERIEVLNDGASAIYGSDAVAGVINIITRTEYEGATVSLKKGISGESDGGQDALSIVTGASNDNTRVLFTADVFKQGIVKATDRDYSNSAVKNGIDGRSAYGYPSSVFKTDFSEAAAPSDCAPENTQPSSNAAAGTECLYDYSSDYQLIPETERYGVFGIVEHDFNDELTGFAQLRYAKSKTITSNAAAPGFLEVEVTNEYLPYVSGLSGVAVGDKVFVARRWNEFGKREKENTNTTAEGVFGVTGSLTDLFFAGDINWSAEAGHSVTKGLQKGINGQLYRADMEAGVANGDINPFDPSANSAETVAKYQQSPEREGELKLSFANLRADGYLDDLDLGWAYGLEARKEKYFDQTTENYDDIIGGASGNGGGDRKVTASYLEFAYNPVDMLELGTAVRYDKYNDFGDSVTGKLSAGLRPMDELLIRASVATGFKAPDLKELYLGKSEGVQKVIDTKVCNETKNSGGTADEVAQACKKKEVYSVSGGNEDLDAEESKSLNFGVVWSVTDQLSASVDYWDITVEDKITTIGAQEILNNEDGFGGEYVDRNPSGQLGGKESGSQITDTYQNVAEERGKGLDIAVNYSLPTDLGQFDFRWDTTHLMSFKRSKGLSGVLCEEAGTYGEPEWKSSLGMNWKREAWSGNATVKYIGSYDDNGSGRSSGCDFENTEEVKSYTTLDLQLGYEFHTGTKVLAGVKNATDEEPPFSKETQWPWYNQALYSPTGRFVYAEMKHTF
ncbi:TonB-dependent receptor [uncultured Endozoicomonas sp.]|uniref:TonB-dependent receptor plug domain-containing protein n=1 Tax=uncultured Endozoicomonas sp. TaxID=432652 RepID=UPI00262B1E26|nr:TonB-dependent receptor [uncultured Endozoicomonas sp.]